MLARQVLIGAMALATLRSTQVPQGQRIDGLILMTGGPPLSNEIGGLFVDEPYTNGAPESLHVTVPGVPTTSNPLPLSGITIQAWLLRADGTALVQRDKPVRRSVNDPGVHSDSIDFTFTPVPLNELAGVVVSVNGKLYVRQMKVHSTP